MQVSRPVVLVATVLGTAVAALNTMVVSTAMPTIVGKLGGLELFPWTFSVYLLAATVTVPLYGKGADLLGRKVMFMTGVGVFLLGSLLCATSGSMEQLVFWRALEGAGAGGVVPMTYTIIGDLYPPAQRARIQGLFSAVWASASVAGPVVGAFIIAHLPWQWIFLVNVPFGLAAIILMTVAWHEQVERRRGRLDLTGALLLSAATLGLMWAFREGAEADLRSPQVAGILCGSVVLGALFVWQEGRHEEPMIPPALIRRPLVAVACGSGFFGAAVLFGLAAYVPTFVQGILGGSASEAGAVLVPLSIAWPVGATLSSWSIRRRGYLQTAIAGGAGVALGAFGVLGAAALESYGGLMAATAVTGLGMGLSMPTLLIAVQETVPWNRRGVATATVQFARHLGGSLVVAVLGALMATTLNASLADQPELLEASNALLDPHRRTALPAETAAWVRSVLAKGLRRALAGVGVCGLIALAIVLIWARPRHFIHHRAE